MKLCRLSTGVALLLLLCSCTSRVTIEDPEGAVTIDPDSRRITLERQDRGRPAAETASTDDTRPPLHQQHEELRKLCDEKLRVEKALVDSRAEHRSVAARIAADQATLASLQERARLDTVAARDRELQRHQVEQRLATKRSELGTVMQELQDSLGRRDTVRSELAALEAQHRNRDQEHKQLQAEISAAAETKHALLTQIAEARRTLAELSERPAPDRNAEPPPADKPREAPSSIARVEGSTPRQLNDNSIPTERMTEGAAPAPTTAPAATPLAATERPRNGMVRFLPHTAVAVGLLALFAALGAAIFRHRFYALDMSVIDESGSRTVHLELDPRTERAALDGEPRRAPYDTTGKEAWGPSIILTRMGSAKLLADGAFDSQVLLNGQPLDGSAAKLQPGDRIELHRDTNDRKSLVLQAVRRIRPAEVSGDVSLAGG